MKGLIIILALLLVTSYPKNTKQWCKDHNQNITIHWWSVCQQKNWKHSKFL